MSRLCITCCAGATQKEIYGGPTQIRPKFMTVATMTIGLVPILWSTDAGADLMKRIAAPMVGGLATSFVMELVVYPVLYMMWRQREISGEVAPHAEFAEHDSRSSKRWLRGRSLAEAGLRYL